jgi:hypothetical protein
LRRRAIRRDERGEHHERNDDDRVSLHRATAAADGPVEPME